MIMGLEQQPQTETLNKYTNWPKAILYNIKTASFQSDTNEKKLQREMKIFTPGLLEQKPVLPACADLRHQGSAFKNYRHCRFTHYMHPKC